MRQGFIIGAIVLWVAINILGSIADMQPMLAQTDTKLGVNQQELMGDLTKPEITDTTFTFIGKIGGYIVTFGKILTLWHPAIWQGSAIYLYFFIIIPIGISFWIVIVMAIRGVGSS